MTSKFTGRDYTTLRAEIIEFLRQRLPNDWDYTNLSDPVVIYAEMLAMMGDQLHYTIDELRRECDIATAKRASSIYSYAMREGYHMMLPRGAFGTLSINSTREQDGMLHLKLNKFDKITFTPTGDELYVVNDNIDADLHAPIDQEYYNSLLEKEGKSLYRAYVNSVYSKTQRVKVVLGKKQDFTFSYSDINSDSTVELPTPYIDRDLIRLQYSYDNINWNELTLVEDVISTGFDLNSYTLTPKFIGGAITLNIEFPTNYKDIFSNNISTQFKFEYIEIKNTSIEPLKQYQDNSDVFNFNGNLYINSKYAEYPDIVDNGMQYRVDLGNGIRGYTEYENPLTTRENYKKFIQNYSALLTKEDYINYIKSAYTLYCKVFDHGDMYKIPEVLPEDANLIPRVIYVLTDANYTERETMWHDLQERSSRSDCIVLSPFGKDPYTIIIKAECDLIGTSADSIVTSIRTALYNYYTDRISDKIPKISKINYLVHNASDKVIRMDTLILRDTTFGTIDTSLNNVNQLSSNDIDVLYNALSTYNLNYEFPDTLTSVSGDEKYPLRNFIYCFNGKYYTPTEFENLKSTYDGDDIEFASKMYYTKYPPLTEKVYIPNTDAIIYSPINEFPEFPESFPKIYKVATDKVIADYDELIETQTAYGEIDSKDWDVEDAAIFNWVPPLDSTTDSEYLNFKYEVTNLDTNITTEEWLYINISDVTADGDNYIVNDDVTCYKSVPNLIEDSGVTVPNGYIISKGNYTEFYNYITMKIPDEYIKHHYMVPVLNNVIVLIKSIAHN